jgi:UDP-perosamine 4-acetyltransferase
MKPEVVIVGSGGHAKVIIDLIRGNREYEIVGCTGVVPGQNNVLGVPVLGDDTVLNELFARGIRKAFVALGDNRLRCDAAARVVGMGFELIDVISAFSCVSPNATLGPGVAVMPGAVINAGAAIGAGAIVNTAASVDHDCVIGDFSHLAPGSHLAGTVTVGNGAFLGVGSTVIARVVVGEWTIVGAGAVVIRDVPAHATVVGVPARVVKQET